MQPLQHFILILLAWSLCQVLPRRAAVHVLGAAGLIAVTIFAPVAAGFILLSVLEACIMVIWWTRLNRSSNWRKYGPYLLLMNFLFVDFHYWILAMPVATLAISFSIIRIFMTTKQLLSSRKKMPLSEIYWIFPAAFFLPAIVIGPVFSGTLLRDQNQADLFVSVELRDYRMVLQGLVLVILVSPAFGSEATIWPFLFLQLFAAFWGQSLIAEHTSRFFGFQLPVNFDHPWKARNIKEFWARWHRSMAQFVLQYIFLPLTLRGVSPKIATVAAFVFMGIWHNLSFGYFVWGLCHGLLLAYSGGVSENRFRRTSTRILMWIIVISLSWFANYGPVS